MHFPAILRTPNVYFTGTVERALDFVAPEMIAQQMFVPQLMLLLGWLALFLLGDCLVGSLPHEGIKPRVVNGSDWTQQTLTPRSDGASTEVVVTTPSSDVVLLVVNLMIIASKRDCSADLTIRRTLVGSHIENAIWKEIIILPCCDQSQSTSFLLTDAPGVPGSYKYALQSNNPDCTRARGQIPLIAAVVLPPSTQTHHSQHNTLTSKFAQTKAIITPHSATDTVFVSVRFSIQTTDTLTTDSVVRVALYRNGTLIDTNPTQIFSLPDMSDKYYTLSYLDSPNTTLPVAYTIGSVHTTDAHNTYHTFTNLTSYITSNITLLCIPATTTNTTMSITALNVSNNTYTPIGLHITIAPQSVTDKVLLTLNMNMLHLTNTTTAVFTILRTLNGTTTYLGDVVAGLYSVRSSTNSYSPVSFTLIDTPNTTGTIVYSVVGRPVCSDSTSTNLTCDSTFVISPEGHARQLTAVILPTSPRNIIAPVQPVQKTRNNSHTNSTTRHTSKSTSNTHTNPISNTTHDTNPYTLAHSMALQSTPDPFPIAQNSIYTTIGGLPALFAITFSLTLPDFLVTAGDTNILEIKDTTSGRSLVKLDRLDAYSTILSYDTNKLYTSAGDTLLPTSVGGITIERTYYRITVQDTSITLESSLPYVRSTPITRVSTAGKVYTLYLSNPTDASSGGDFSYFSLTGVTAPPSASPTEQPVANPSRTPSRPPTMRPTSQPSSQPSAQPSRQPFGRPSAQPSRQPSSQPSRQPSAQPNASPTGQPTSSPTRQPSGQPSSQPSSHPSRQPSGQPTSTPTRQPSAQPSTQPTSQPVLCPTSQPSRQPTSRPSGQPSAQPSRQPSTQPSRQPTGQPSRQPSSRPSSQPSVQPSMQPTSQPSARPTGQPSSTPSAQPSVIPSSQPSRQPSGQPSVVPTQQPSVQPSSMPSAQPSEVPSTQPSVCPTAQPSLQPSAQPSSLPSSQPTTQPTSEPSIQPSEQPSAVPSVQPSCRPTSQPSTQPTQVPSTQPTRVPSTQPSVQPSSLPTQQPSTQPSTVPTVQPSSVPTSQPSMQPSVMPTIQPSCQPSTQPSSLPTTHPSAQPSQQPTLEPTSQPTAAPNTQPTTVPSPQPSLTPSVQPTSQPTTQPSKQPASSPTTQPSTQPSSQPSSRPSLAPTGEWATVVSQTSLLTKVSYPDRHVWACGKNSGGVSGVLCVLAELDSGELVSQYMFAWDSVLAVLSTGSAHSVVMSGKNRVNGVTTSDMATCGTDELQLRCIVRSFASQNFLAVSFVPLPNILMYVGFNSMYPSATLVDLTTNTIRSYVYASSNIKDFTLSQVQSPSYFVGAFVAGTAVRATATPVNYIVAGMVRTDAGILNAMILTPQVGEIVNSVDLVTTMALEVLGPDSFIAGGLQIDDGIGTHAYLLRVNALFMLPMYCVRYRSSDVKGSRRVLRGTTSDTSVVRGVVLVDTTLFMIVDYTLNNVTSLTVLKTSITDGAIIKQVHIAAPNSTSLCCTDITNAGKHLSIVCHIHNTASQLQSVLMLVDRDLSFEVLPIGFVRTDNTVFYTENVPFQRTVLSVTKTSTAVSTTVSDVSTGNTNPTHLPTISPTHLPSRQPSSAPSAQPSSSPTAAPSVSARPTSQPSSASPTNTHKPTAAPTIVPTRKPSVTPSVRPSFRATPNPSVRPTLLPSTVPTLTPTTKPTTSPTRLPASNPTTRPTVTPTTRPTIHTSMSAMPTVYTEVVVTDDRKSSLPPYVVGASVGGGLALLLVCGVLYQYYQNDRENKAREMRKAEYYRQQAILEQARIETAKFIEKENQRLAAENADKARTRAAKIAAARRKRSISCESVHDSARSSIAPSVFALAAVSVPAVARELSSDGSSSYNVSSMGSSEKSAFKQAYATRRRKRAPRVTVPATLAVDTVHAGAGAELYDNVGVDSEVSDTSDGDDSGYETEYTNQSSSVSSCDDSSVSAGSDTSEELTMSHVV